MSAMEKITCLRNPFLFKKRKFQCDTSVVVIFDYVLGSIEPYVRFNSCS